MSSSLIPIPIATTTATATDSPYSLTVTRVPLFKPPNHRHSVTTRARRGQLLYLRLPFRYITPLRCSSGDDDGAYDSIVVLHVGGMMCEGCAGNVKRILESRPQVSSATVNLTSEIAIVSPVPEQKTAPNWQKQLGEALAQHLTTCGFTSTFRDQEDSC